MSRKVVAISPNGVLTVDKEDNTMRYYYSVPYCHKGNVVLCLYEHKYVHTDGLRIIMNKNLWGLRILNLTWHVLCCILNRNIRGCDNLM